MSRRKRTPSTAAAEAAKYGYGSSAPKAVEPRTETDAALEAGEDLARLKFAGTAIRIEDGRPYRITEDDKVQSLEGYLLNPVSRRGTIAVYDASSFVDYVNRFKSTATIVFSDNAAATLTAVFDYHNPGPVGDAGWGRHRVVLALRPTRQWKAWAEANKNPMNQAQFAQFLEDHIPEIGEPAGALLVEIARTLQAKKDVVFESNIQRQTDGSFRFHYAENVQGTAGRGDLQIPDKFLLVLKPFEGEGDPYRVEARFRYRIGEGGKLHMWFELVGVDDILESAFNRSEESIRAGVDETFVVNGPAPAAVTASQE